MLVFESNPMRPWLARESPPGQPASIRVSVFQRTSAMRSPNPKYAFFSQFVPTPVVLPQSCSSAGLPSVRSNAMVFQLYAFGPLTLMLAGASR